ncbi:MAG: LysE family translocator [Opitutaceae bacterium]|nr:LysE family translocator [Opitutaceae bacterium]
MFSQLAALLGILTVGLISPGPDFFLIVKNSMSGSRSRAFATGWGIAAGLCIQVLALSLGLAVAPPKVLLAVQLAGAAFLAWVGLKALLAKSEATKSDAAKTEEALANRGARIRKRGQAAAGFMEGFLCNVTNVKVFVFFTSIFSQFVTDDSSASWRVLMPAVVVLHGAVMWTLITWALLFPPVARQLARMQRWLPRVFGMILIGFAGFALFLAWKSLRG